MNVVAKLKKELIEAGRRAYQRGIQTGNGGNISARIPGYRAHDRQSQRSILY